MTLESLPAGTWLALLPLWVALSIAYRRWVGKPLVASPRPDAVHAARWSSTRIGAGLVARLGTARNCMHVQVTGTALHIHPHFPFTLGFMPEIYGLDHVIPLDRIRSARLLSEGRSQAVEVRYDDAAVGDGCAQLLLRQGEAFVQALLAAQAQGRGAS